MADIIDFNKKKKAASGGAPFDIASLIGKTMPENELTGQVVTAIADKMSRLILLTEIAKEASGLIQDAGFDPDEFNLDDEAFNIFLTTEIEEGDLEHMSTNQLWNGPRFYFEGQGFEVRVASTVAFDADDNTVFSIDILKLDDGADRWLFWSNGGWQAGPPEDVFDYVDALHQDMLDEDDDGEYSWSGDDDDDEWESSIDSMMMPPNVIEALRRAGIVKIADLAHMTDAELLSIKGIGKKSLADIREALEYEDD